MIDQVQVYLFDWRARSFVLGRGKDGCEHAYCYCKKHIRFIAHHTDGQANSVTIPKNVAAKCKSATELVSFHHNHPAKSPLSYGDIELLGRFPGLLEISAHTSDGGTFRARRSTRWKSSWKRRLDTLDAGFTFQSLALQATPGFAGPLEQHAFGLVLERAKLIEYDYILDRNLRSLYDLHRVSIDSLVREIANLGQ